MTDQPGSESTVESTSKRATRAAEEGHSACGCACPDRTATGRQPVQPDEAQEGGQRIEATTVRMTRSGSGRSRGRDHHDPSGWNRGGVCGGHQASNTAESARPRPDDIAVRMGGIGIARGERVSVELGAIGLAVGGDVSIVQGAARAVVARDVQMKQTLASTVMAGSVTMDRQSGAFIVIARRVDGTVRAVLDWRGALALGAAMGVAIALLGRRKKT